MKLHLVGVAVDDPRAAALVEAVQQEYVVRYGGRDETPVTDAEFAPPHGWFVVATVDGEAVGCAGLRRHGDAVVEIKRMFVHAAHRRRGLGRRLLHAVEDHARDHGYQRVVLETGTEQPEAMALYAGEGYTPIPPYGHHRCSPRSRCFAKNL